MNVVGGAHPLRSRKTSGARIRCGYLSSVGVPLPRARARTRDGGATATTPVSLFVGPGPGRSASPRLKRLARLHSRS